MKKYTFYSLYLIIFVSLAGCGEVKLLERVGLTTLIGYDRGSEDGVTTTAVVRQVSSDFESKITILSAENETSQGTRVKVNRMSSKKIMAGQMRVVLFSEELAQKGISHYIDTLLKNSEISGNVLLAVVEGETQSLLEYQYDNIVDIGDHIYKQLEQNIKGEQMISSTLHEVGYDHYSIGKEIALPILTRNEEQIEISGIALFKDGEMVGKVSAEDSFYVKLLRDHYNIGKLELTINGDELPSSIMENLSDEIILVFDPIKTKKKVTLSSPSTPEFAINISMQARLIEIKPHIDVDKPDTSELLNKVIAKKLDDEINRVIGITQEVGSDVFGSGEIFRSTVRHSDLTKDTWPVLYENMTVTVRTDFTLLRNGVME